MRPMISNIFKDLVLVFGILFIVWGMGQVQMGNIHHGVGTEATPIDTQMASPGSMIFVHVTSSNTTVTRVVSLENRKAFFENGSLVDQTLAAGGSNAGGKGRDVNLNSYPSDTSTAYRIVVLDENEETTDLPNLDYTIQYYLWMPNFTLILIGFLWIFMFFVLRAISRVQTRSVPVDLEERPEPAPPMRAPPTRAMGPQAPPARGPMGRQPQPPARAPPARAPPPVYEEPPPEEYYPPEEEAPMPEPEPEPEYAPPPQPARAPPPSAQKPVAKIRCSACGEIIPIFTKNRPIRVTCSNCGRSGTLK